MIVVSMNQPKVSIYYISFPVWTVTFTELHLNLHTLDIDLETEPHATTQFQYPSSNASDMDDNQDEEPLAAIDHLIEESGPTHDLFADPFDGELEEPFEVWADIRKPFEYRDSDEESDVEDASDAQMIRWLDEHAEDRQDWERIVHNIGEQIVSGHDHYLCSLKSLTLHSSSR